MLIALIGIGMMIVYSQFESALGITGVQNSESVCIQTYVGMTFNRTFTCANGGAMKYGTSGLLAAGSVDSRESSQCLLGTSYCQTYF